jgi:hypothetical protein
MKLSQISHLLNELAIPTIPHVFSDSHSLIATIKNRIYRGTEVVHIATKYYLAAEMGMIRIGLGNGLGIGIGNGIKNGLGNGHGNGIGKGNGIGNGNASGMSLKSKLIGHVCFEEIHNV